LSLVVFDQHPDDNVRIKDNHQGILSVRLLRMAESISSNVAGFAGLRCLSMPKRADGRFLLAVMMTLPSLSSHTGNHLDHRLSDKRGHFVNIEGSLNHPSASAIGLVIHERFGL